MKNVIFAVTVLFFALQGCKKEDKCDPDAQIEVASASEVEVLHQYIVDNKIEARKDERGFFYKIQTTGTGKKPDICSKIRVNYVGTLTNGAIFDQQIDSEFSLGEVINGWRAGIPLIGEGDKITLYLPPSMGYGAKGIGGIPGNAILIFSIDLVKVY